MIEPTEEKCYYSHNLTKNGGMMTKDLTQGYGPEVYLINKAIPGKYTIKANFYGTRQQNLTGGTTVQATVITDYGRPTEKHKSITVRLTSKKQVIDIGDISLDQTKETSKEVSKDAPTPKP